MKNSYVYNIFIILLYKLQYTTLWQIDCHGYNNKNNFGEETFLDKFRHSWVFLFIIFKCLLHKIRLSFHRVGSRTTNDTIYTFSVYTFNHSDFVLH